MKIGVQRQLAENQKEEQAGQSSMHDSSADTKQESESVRWSIVQQWICVREKPHNTRTIRQCTPNTSATNTTAAPEEKGRGEQRREKEGGMKHRTYNARDILFKQPVQLTRGHGETFIPAASSARQNPSKASRFSTESVWMALSPSFTHTPVEPPTMGPVST